MHALYSLFAVFLLVTLAMAGKAAGMTDLLLVYVPYLAVGIFILGVIAKVLGWAKTPVPFRIPTTAGQQKSLDFIAHDKLDNPATSGQTFIRMALEVLCFRSLLRNATVQRFGEAKDGVDIKFRYGTALGLWVFAIIFHYSFLVVVIRHFRLFLEPVPVCLQFLEAMDGFFQIGAPVMYFSSVGLLLGVLLLLGRRMVCDKVRYISIAADYFPLLLILGITTSGILMRHFAKTDIMTIKEFLMALFSFNFAAMPPMENIGVVFYVHVFLVSVLLMYFPFSKLMHMGGVFLSPTRNLPNDSRTRYHENPWNDPTIKPHSYEAYEDDYREKMIEAGLPVEKTMEETESADANPA